MNETIHDIEFGGKGNVGIVGTCFNIFKCFIGIGLLAIPSAFSEVRLVFLSKKYVQIGIIGGSIGIILIGCLNYYSMML